MPNATINRPTLGYTLALLCLLVPLQAASDQAHEQAFPRPPSLQRAVDFWTRVYTQVDSTAGYVHDSRRLNVIYETLEFKAGSSPRDQDRTIAETLRRYRKALVRLSEGDQENNDAYQHKVLAAWGADVSARTLAQAADRVRFQRGQSDRFRAGLQRSGAWDDHIRAILNEHGLPEELAALPHVESSYNPSVRSHAGAAGLWQLTAMTAKRFLEISEVVDERMDPYRATEAAARFLLQNYSVLKSWPLAITAYNHGMSGVRRAVRTTGNEDIGVIVRRYNGPRFGFASRNFYAAFLAATDVAADAPRHFGPIDRHEPADRHTVELPAYFPVAVLTRELGLDAQRLKTLNPALGTAVWVGHKYVPQGYRLRLPLDMPAEEVRERLQGIASVEGFAAQKPDQYYKVKPGDTLSVIAVRYATDVSILMAMNDLSNSAMIRAGRVLRLPTSPEVPRPGPTVEIPTADKEEAAPAATVVVSTEQSHAVTEIPESDGALPVEAAPGIGADPGDYQVAPDNTIEVAIGETLGHYAEWLETHSGEIRRLNGLRKGQHIMMGQRIRLAFHKARPEVFEQRRLTYHERLQLDYFGRYRIVGACSHALRKGDSLWQIAKQEYGIPLWLLRQYNPDVDANEILAQGVSLLVPLVAPIGKAGDATGENTTVGRESCPGSSRPVLSSIPRRTPTPRFASAAGEMRVEEILNKAVTE